MNVQVDVLVHFSPFSRKWAENVRRISWKIIYSKPMQTNLTAISSRDPFKSGMCFPAPKVSGVDIRRIKSFSFIILARIFNFQEMTLPVLFCELGLFFLEKTLLKKYLWDKIK